jgi:NADH:ubiquinone oxidoreductase subunit E
VDADGPLNKEVCKGCGICIEHCPTSALTWPGGAKKKEGAPKTKMGEPKGDSSSRHALLNLLEERQRMDGFLSETAMTEIANKVDLAIGEVYGVATFYSLLSTKPRGKHVIRICKGVPCYLRSGELVVKAVAAELGIRPGETTTDRLFSFELTNCIGACDRAPAMLVDDTVYGNLNGEKVADILKSYRSL